MLKRLNSGAYGSAYLVCLKHRPEEQYVLKKISLDQANERERQQAEMEVKVLQALDHPFVLGCARPPSSRRPAARGGRR